MNRRNILPIVSAAGLGLVFGIGLAISQMTDPAKVKAFLDVSQIFDGTWDASLIFVMGTAFVVTFAIYRLAGRRTAPLIGSAFVWPKRGEIDRQLVIGSAVFGVGWGLSGLCPGPAIADLGLAPGELALFVVAMLAGSWGTGLVLAMRAEGAGGRLAGGNVPAA